MSGVAAMREGQALESRTFLVTREGLLAYAEAGGDHNPIHRDDEAARAIGLPGVVAHGMYTMALAARAVEEWALDQRGGEPGEVRELGCRFTRPVPVPAHGGVEVVVAATVKQLEETDGRRVAHLALEVTVDGDPVLAAARAVVVGSPG